MNKIFNWKIGLIAIFGFGIITFIVNRNGSGLLTILAVLKEVTFRFFWAGFSGRLTQKIADRHKGITAYFLATVGITFIVLVLTFILHYFTLTPHPIKTVLINGILTFFSEIGTVFLFKKGLMKV